MTATPPFRGIAVMGYAPSPPPCACALRPATVPAMPAAKIFSDAHREFVRRAYLTQGFQPVVITSMLNAKFGSTFTGIQVQRLVNQKWSKKRRVFVERAKELNLKSDAQLTRELSAKVMDDFAGRAVKGATKAFDMLDRANDARTLSAAASAAKSLVTTYRVCSGLDGVGAGGPRAATFNFNFANVVAARSDVQQLVEVAPLVAEVVLGDDDVDDDDDDDVDTPKTSSPELQTPAPMSRPAQPQSAGAPVQSSEPARNPDSPAS